MATTTTTTTSSTTTLPSPYPEVVFYEANRTPTEIQKITNDEGALTFGTIAPGENSDLLIAQLKVPNVRAISNIKVGIPMNFAILYAVGLLSQGI